MVGLTIAEVSGGIKVRPGREVLMSFRLGFTACEAAGDIEEGLSYLN
jgi:hypothetical protein